MRENYKMMALTAILAAGVVLAGCGATNSAASSTVVSATSTASSEAEKTEVQPMQGISRSDPLADGTYHISFEKDKVWVGERTCGQHGSCKLPGSNFNTLLSAIS